MDNELQRFRLASLRSSFKHTGATVALVWRSSPRLTVLLGGLTLVGAGLGALYPGLSAASHDPIEALAYE